jgi:hypothetical protein
MLVTAALLTLPAAAHAEECSNAIGGDPAIDAFDAQTRSRWLHSTLRTESRRADVWTWGWVGAGVAGTGVNVALGATGDYDARVDRFGAAAGTLAMTGSTLVQPLRVPNDGDGETCADVHRREKVLLAVAEDELRGQSWFAHLLPLAGSLAGGLVLGAGYGHWTGGALNAAIGIAVSELKILTQPMGGVRGLERYRAGILSADGPVGLSVTPVLGNQGGGATLTLSY